jgi:hypothetical protein
MGRCCLLFFCMPAVRRAARGVVCLRLLRNGKSAQRHRRTAVQIPYACVMQNVAFCLQMTLPGIDIRISGRGLTESGNCDLMNVSLLYPMLYG